VSGNCKNITHLSRSVNKSVNKFCNRSVTPQLRGDGSLVAIFQRCGRQDEAGKETQCLLHGNYWVSLSGEKGSEMELSYLSRGLMDISIPMGDLA